VPLFHCNGWCHTWMMPLVGGTIVFVRNVTAKDIYHAVSVENVSHFGGAPIVLNMLVNAPEDERAPFDHTVHILTAGAPPAPATLNKITECGFGVMHVYGLTETYGHVTECYWNAPQWDGLSSAEQTSIKSRQGVASPMMDHVTVMDADMKQIPMDGVAQGEIMLRGNAVMKGYLKNPDATREAFEGGYFHSGDIAVQHPDYYFQIADRAKDIIISGGENISSVEVEGTLMHHPAVNLCAVVAKPDDKWGEVPCAFVELKPGHSATEQEMIAFAREHLAGFKTPKQVVFGDVPKTATGKIRKFELRKRAQTL
jgi:fatty-acyl-CoA synthase